MDVRKGCFHRQLCRGNRHRDNLGVDPYSKGSSEVTALLQGTEGGCQEWVEAHFVVEKDIDKLGDRMIESIEAKRAALGI